MRVVLWAAFFVVVGLSLVAARPAVAQSFGIEMHNTAMPASGGMAGTSLALPQDLVSAVHGNPATMTQFKGTQFMLGGAWSEPTIDITQAGGVLPNVGAYTGKSGAQGALLPAVGITQDLSELGLPAVFGISLAADAGGAVDMRHIPASNGTNSSMLFLGMNLGLGMSLTERLAVGASMTVGIGYFDAPFVGAGGMTNDYALRGTLGATYLATDTTTIGVYYQTQERFRFDDAVRLDLGGGAFTQYFDVNFSLPENIGIGIANNGLMDGRLLLAADFLYKLWDQAALFDNVYNNQFVVQLGAQYSYEDYRFRVGYAYAQNPLQTPPGPSAGGIAPPGAINAIEYLQTQVAVINQNRITMGVGRRDVLPGIDMDFMAGGLMPESSNLGPFTSVKVQGYWVAVGLTWRFGRGACERLPVVDHWSE